MPPLSPFVPSPDVVLPSPTLFILSPKTNGQWAGESSIETTHVLEQEPLIEAQNLNHFAPALFKIKISFIFDTAGTISLGYEGKEDVDDVEDVNGQRGGLMVLARRVFEPDAKSPSSRQAAPPMEMKW